MRAVAKRAVWLSPQRSHYYATYSPEGGSCGCCRAHSQVREWFGQSTLCLGTADKRSWRHYAVASPDLVLGLPAGKRSDIYSWDLLGSHKVRTGTRKPGSVRRRSSSARNDRNPKPAKTCPRSAWTAGRASSLEIYRSDHWPTRWPLRS